MNSSPEEPRFALALAKPTEKRALFPRAICAGYPALRQRQTAD
jgi:hypothetical protein